MRSQRHNCRGRSEAGRTRGASTRIALSVFLAPAALDALRGLAVAGIRPSATALKGAERPRLSLRTMELNSHQLNEAAADLSTGLGRLGETAPRCRPPVGSRDCRAGFATSGQTFGICCHSGVQESRPGAILYKAATEALAFAERMRPSWPRWRRSLRTGPLPLLTSAGYRWGRAASGPRCRFSECAYASKDVEGATTI
jgi:hypothetical protein